MIHDPGGKTRLSLPEGVRGSAYMSGCGRFRYTLWRYREDAHADPYIMFIGMNPSTAAHDVDDPTVRREWGHAVRFSVNRMLKMNISPYRATNPKDVIDCGYEMLVNRNSIIDYAQQATRIVLAWGVVPKVLTKHAEATLDALRETGRKLECLGTTQDGHPRHPLYLRADTPLVEFAGPWP